MRSKTWISSVVKYNCPRCRSFGMFKAPFNLKDPLAMLERCGHCGQKFTPEPGFYYGAMFLSYILSGWLLLLTALVLVFYFDWTVENTMLVIILIGILSYFKLMRFSRSLYIHLVVRYRGKDADHPSREAKFSTDHNMPSANGHENQK